MSYTIDLSITIASDRLTATLNDDTVYGTGGNPVRANVRVFANGYKMNFDNTVSKTLTLTGDSGDPQTDVTWQYNLPADGWSKFNFVIIKDEYDVDTPWNLYDAVYSGSSVYRSKVASNQGNALSNTAYWEFISDPASLASNKDEVNESTNIESIVYQRILIPNGQYGFSNYVSQVSWEVDADDPVENYAYNTLAVLVDGALVADERSELPEGETIARKLETYLSLL